MPSHAFVEEVLSVCEMPASLTEEIMKQLLSPTQNFSQNRVVTSANLLQLSVLNEMDLNDVDLPSTQPCHNNQSESGKDLILHLSLIHI